MASLGEYLETLGTKTGYPVRATQGRLRAVAAINSAMRQVKSDLPEHLFRSEWRFRMEVPVTTGVVNVDSIDPLVLYLVGAPLGTWKQDGTHNARTILVYTGSVWVKRRIREVFQATISAVVRDCLTLDEPWQNTTDTALAYRIVTEDYPYPESVQKIRKMYYTPESAKNTAMIPAILSEVQELRIGVASNNSGVPSVYARSVSYQLPAPHFVPEVRLLSTSVPIPTTSRWGYDSSGVERGAPFVGERYGAAGTFKYRACLVWGRRPWLQQLASDRLAPFYISPPSAPSAAITTTWAGSAIVLDLVDMSYGFGFGNDATLLSYLKSGLEYWIYRSRSATESPSSGTNNAAVKRIEADSQYYLWRTVPAWNTAVIDRGDYDPPDRTVPLTTCTGQSHLRFDVYPSAADDVMLDIVHRLPALSDDADSPGLPPEAEDLLITKVCSMLAGDRDGDPSRKADYEAEYQREVAKLCQATTVERFVQATMGDFVSHPRADGWRINLRDGG